MKIIDTFLFSEPFEADLLWVKLNLEFPVVDLFIGLECDHTFRGEYKDNHLWNVLQEPRFEPFLEKILIISKEGSLLEGPPCEKNFFGVEFKSRALCWDYLKDQKNEHKWLFPNVWDDNTWIIMSDVDESLDFTHSYRRDVILAALENAKRGIQIRNQKAWYDFDNINFWREKYIPIHPLGLLKSGPNTFGDRNGHCDRFDPDHIILGFEYAYCFSEKNNWRKLNTFAHDRYEKSDLETGLTFNHWHKSKNRGEYLSGPLDFFETIELNEYNSPKFVLENIDKLKVNTIDLNYAENRLNAGYPPHPAKQAGLMRGNKINKAYDYFRR